MTLKGKTRTRNARVDILKANARIAARKARLEARVKAKSAYNRQQYDGHYQDQESQ